MHEVMWLWFWLHKFSVLFCPKKLTNETRPTALGPLRRKALQLCTYFGLFSPTGCYVSPGKNTLLLRSCPGSYDYPLLCVSVASHLWHTCPTSDCLVEWSQKVFLLVYIALNLMKFTFFTIHWWMSRHTLKINLFHSNHKPDLIGSACNWGLPGWLIWSICNFALYDDRNISMQRRE